MRRWLGGSLALVMFLVAAGAGAMYGRDPVVYDAAYVVVAGDLYELGVFERRLDFRWTGGVGEVPKLIRLTVALDKDPQPLGYNGPTTPPHRFVWGWSTWDSEKGTHRGRCLQAGVPLWFVVALAGPWPLLWAVGFWRRRKNRYGPGHCRQCGYDLRAHLPGQNCPECGTVVPADHTPTFP